MPTVLSYPDVNGLRPDFARIAVALPGRFTAPGKGFRAITYKDRSNGELVMHNSQLPAGQTSGQISPEGCSITMLIPEFQSFRQAVSDSDVPGGSDLVGLLQSGIPSITIPSAGAYTSMWDMLVQYGGINQAGLPYHITDLLFGCRMTGSENVHRSSGGALEATFPFQPTLIVVNGSFPDDAEDLLESAKVLLNVINSFV